MSLTCRIAAKVALDGKPIAKVKTPAIAEDIADRLNEDDYRKEQDGWSA
jgi:hypothetical protein